MSQRFQLVFGLTADPIHLGHEQVIINSIEYFRKLNKKIGQFLLVPVFNPNLIAGKKSPHASFDQRLEMCQLVANRLSKKLKTQILVSDIEKKLSQKTGKSNYSFDTLKALELKRGLVIACADHFKGRWPKFRKWHCWQNLVKGTGLLINRRPGNKINLNFIKGLQKINKDVYVVESDKSVNTSSTFIRKNIKCNFDMSNHLSDDIMSYISQKSLYQNSDSLS